VLYGSVLLALGSLLLLAWMPWPAGVRGTVVRQGRLAALVAGVTFVLAIGLVGAQASGGDGDSPVGRAAWQIGLESSLGRSAGFGVPAALLALWALGSRSAIAQQLAAVLFIAAMVVTGHAATAAPLRVMASSVALHVGAAAFWSAALWPLATASRILPALECGALLEVFASRAVGMLITLLVSGLVLMLVQVGPLRNLVTTSYGIRLSGKILLVLALLGLAARNNLVLTPALLRDDARAREPFRRAALAELGLIVLATALAASLTLVEPPRSLDAPTAAVTTAR
jgi:copper transport protein